MTKLQFIISLRDQLWGFPKQDVEERLNFYSEMIEDRVEEGLSEEEAVAAVGSVDEIAAQISMEFDPLEKKKKKRRLKVWELLLIILGSPVWIALALAIFAVILSVYISLWAIVISLWAVFGSLIAGGLGGVMAGISFAFGGNRLTGLVMIGAGMVCLGLSIFSYFGCIAATKGMLVLTKKGVLIFRKEEQA